MATRYAACSCEQLRLTVEGEPLGGAVCHCLACQRRTGSAFSVQAAFGADQVRIEGRNNEYARLSDQGEERIFSFCPECGATVFYREPSIPGEFTIPVGAFADPAFPEPAFSLWERRRHPWVGLPDGIEHFEGDPD